MNTVINKYNVNYLNQLYEYLIDKNPKYWRIDIPFISGRMKKNVDEIGILDIDYIVQKLATLIKRNINSYIKPFEMFIYNIYSPNLENYDFAEKKPNIHPCSYNKRNLGIRGLGEVTPCARFLDLKLSSVRDQGIREAKKSDLYINFWNIKVSDFTECKSCRYYRICGSGCRANAYEKYGDIMRKDPLNCEIFPAMEKYIIPLFSEETQKSFRELLNES